MQTSKLIHCPSPSLPSMRPILRVFCSESTENYENDILTFFLLSQFWTKKCTIFCILSNNIIYHCPWFSWGCIGDTSHKYWNWCAYCNGVYMLVGLYLQTPDVLYCSVDKPGGYHEVLVAVFHFQIFTCYRN